MKRERLMTCLNFIAMNVFCSIFQLIVLLILIIVQFVLWFVSAQLIWHVLGNEQLGIKFAPFISWGIVFMLYALVWFVFWMISFYGEIEWLYWRIAFSTLPLIIALFMFNPNPNPMAMIPLSMTEIKFLFSTIVTGMVLFPLYSIGLNKFVFMKQSRNIKIRNLVYVCLTMIGIGSVSFLIGWNIMQDIYN